MIEEYKADYLYSHTRSMIQEEQRKDLSNLFLLLSPIPKALDPVVAEFEEHVRSQGLAALSRLQLNKVGAVCLFVCLFACLFVCLIFDTELCGQSNNLCLLFVCFVWC